MATQLKQIVGAEVKLGDKLRVKELVDIASSDLDAIMDGAAVRGLDETRPMAERMAAKVVVQLVARKKKVNEELPTSPDDIGTQLSSASAKIGDLDARLVAVEQMVADMAGTLKSIQAQLPDIKS